jgi:superfamily II DNA or RNA helicase
MSQEWGELTISKNVVKIDCLPFVMQKIRPLFKQTLTSAKGKYSHSTISITLTIDAAKDLDMIQYRYNLKMSKEVSIAIKAKCDLFDSIQLSLKNASSKNKFKVSKNALKQNITLRDLQEKFANIASVSKKILLADPVGMGKTYSALALTLEPSSRPALVVVKPSLLNQWDAYIKRFTPDATTHTIKNTKPYDLPDVDYILTTYTRLKGWEDYLISDNCDFKTLIYDEVHELRGLDTQKRSVAEQLSERIETVVGLSGTPIINYGEEIWSVLDAINPGCLGARSGFVSEWCGYEGVVKDPLALHSFLVSSGLMVRRENIRITPPVVEVIQIDSDLKTLKDHTDILKVLALSVLEQKVGVSTDSAREFDWKLRMMTGVAKAKPVAHFVKDLIDQGEKVLLGGWHRDVYEIWLKELKDYNPVLFTGSESPAQKQKSFDEFVSGNSKVMIMSLRSAEGIDGIQTVCNNVVVGELDWSPKITEQLLGRIDREGQKHQVNAFYLTVNDGSDPYMIEVNGLKSSQSTGIVTGKEGSSTLMGSEKSANERMMNMAKSYLKSIGESVEEKSPEGFFGELTTFLKSIKTHPHNEKALQAELNDLLVNHFSNDSISREVRLSPRSILDFLCIRANERVAIEVKIESTNRQAVYRQVRRYAEEGKITSLILFAPWSGVDFFEVDGIRVQVVNYLNQSLR